jgi:hypothetical protein
MSQPTEHPTPTGLRHTRQVRTCRVAFAAQLHAPSACGLRAAAARSEGPRGGGFSALRVSGDGATLAATRASDGVVCVVAVRGGTAAAAEARCVTPARLKQGGPWADEPDLAPRRQKSPVLPSEPLVCRGSGVAHRFAGTPPGGRWGYGDELGFWREAEPSHSLSALRATATGGGGGGDGAEVRGRRMRQGPLATHAMVS